MGGRVVAPRSDRSWWPLVRLLGGVAALGIVGWQLGVGPFVDGIRAVDATAMAAAAGIGAVTTICCAWRWRVVARGLGIRLGMGQAVSAYYASQFLNTTLPGGVLGDVHRGVRHGRAVEDVGLGVRAVAWERAAGLVVAIALMIGLLVVLPSPVQPWLPAAGLSLAALGAAGIAIGARASRRTPRTGPPGSLGEAGPAERSGAPRWWVRLRSAVAADLRTGLLVRAAWPAILLSSGVVLAGHTATFLIAAGAAGVTASPIELLPLALLALLAMVLPLNVGGWGPREGVAAWAFGAAGIGAAQGVAAATVYGVLTLVATLPGAVVLLARSASRRAGAGAGLGGAAERGAPGGGVHG